MFDFKVVVYSSELLEEQEKFDNKVVNLFSYKTYEGLSAGTGYSSLEMEIILLLIQLKISLEFLRSFHHPNLKYQSLHYYPCI